MSSLRRTTLLAGMSICFSRYLGAATAISPLGEVPPNPPRGQTPQDTAKHQVLLRANEQWKADWATKYRSGAYLEPPLALVPFKDFDYYYTRGSRAIWRPNSGQNYAPVSVPEGFVTDLTSIPQILWSSGLRPEGPYAYAAIIHDYLYWTQDRSREEADKIFLIAMEDSKVEPSLRNRIYNAVLLLGGGAWSKNAELKQSGEKRTLKSFPTDFTISWNEWKARPNVFAD